MKNQWKRHRKSLLNKSITVMLCKLIVSSQVSHGRYISENVGMCSGWGGEMILWEALLEIELMVQYVIIMVQQENHGVIVICSAEMLSFYAWGGTSLTGSPGTLIVSRQWFVSFSALWESKAVWQDTSTSLPMGLLKYQQMRISAKYMHLNGRENSWNRSNSHSSGWRAAC